MQTDKHLVDLANSCAIVVEYVLSLYLQQSDSIQPRTSLPTFGARVLPSISTLPRFLFYCPGPSRSALHQPRRWFRAERHVGCRVWQPVYWYDLLARHPAHLDYGLRRSALQVRPRARQSNHASDEQEAGPDSIGPCCFLLDGSRQQDESHKVRDARPHPGPPARSVHGTLEKGIIPAS